MTWILKNLLPIIKLRLEYFISALIVLFILLWTLSGTIFPTKRPLEVDAYKLDNVLHKVATDKIKTTKKIVYTTSYANIDSSVIVDVKPEVIGKIEAVIAKEGTLIKKGDVILTIENSRQEQALEKSKALFKQKESEYKVEQELLQKGYGAKVKLDAAFTSLKEAQYFLKNSEVELEHTIVKSPIDGVIDKIHYHVGDLITAGNILLTRVHMPNYYVAHTFVSEKQILNINAEEEVVIMLYNSKSFIGKVNFISKIANPETKTYKVDVSFFSEEIIPVGMSAKVKLPLQSLNSYYIKSSYVFLNDEGLIGIKIVDAQSIVRFIPIEILYEEDGGFWIKTKKDTEDELQLITLGGNFVKEEDKVSL